MRAPLPPRRALTEVLVGGAFVAVAVLIAVFAEGDGELDPGVSAALVLMFAAAVRVDIDVGVTYTTPVQLAFVPMLLLLPTSFVPLLVLLGWTLGKLTELIGPNRIHPDRLLLVPGDCWFAVGPALVLIGWDAQTPDWSDWHVYLAVLPAQFLPEAFVSYLRDWLAEGVAPRLVLKELLVVWGIDALLSPLGLLAAFAALTFDYAFLLLIPVVGLLGVYARERAQRLASALALADAARDREDLIAGASHELVTPLGVLVGLTDRLAHGGTMTDDRRSQLDLVMRREVLALRQIVRQFVDYTRIKTERDLLLHPQPCDLGAVAREVAPVEAPADLPPVLVDHSRAQQMITSIAAGATVLRLSANATAVVVSAEGAPPQDRPFAEGGEGTDAGLGLYVTRELARVQGGDLEAFDDGGVARYVLTLPRA